MTLYNSLSQLNEFADEATYRLSGKVEMKGQPNISLSTMQASGEMPMPFASPRDSPLAGRRFDAGAAPPQPGGGGSACRSVCTFCKSSGGIESRRQEEEMIARRWTRNSTRCVQGLQEDR